MGHVVLTCNTPVPTSYVLLVPSTSLLSLMSDLYTRWWKPKYKEDELTFGLLNSPLHIMAFFNSKLYVVLAWAQCTKSPRAEDQKKVWFEMWNWKEKTFWWNCCEREAFSFGQELQLQLKQMARAFWPVVTSLIDWFCDWTSYYRSRK